MARHRGGQPGNKNAAGTHKPGGGAPLGNENALKHGGYAVIRWEDLTEEELELIATIPTDTEELLWDEIALLAVRERRIMHMIRWAESANGGLLTSATVQTMEAREFDTEDEKREYYRRIYEAGDRLPGQPYHSMEMQEAAHNVVMRLEAALTRCQAQKQRAIDCISRWRKESGNQQSDITDSLLQALMGTATVDG